MFEYDKHYRECQQLNKPFIKARTNPSHGRYHVQIDLMTCNYGLTQDEQQEIKKLFQNEIESNLIESNFHDYSITTELAWFDGVSVSSVDNFCNTLYDLTQKYHD